MFHRQIQIEPARLASVMSAAEEAARAVPPAFPLDATVAVNPFLGRPGDDLSTAAARFGRAAGVVLTRPRADYAAMVADGRIADDDLAAALIAEASPLKPADLALLKARLTAPTPRPVALPTVAELAARATGTDWPAVTARCLGLWAAGFFDRGQALWTPAPGHSAFAGWREWATHDLTPEIAGLAGFCAHVAACPDTPERAILRAADRLGLTDESAGSVFQRLFADLGGWAQHARYLLWQAELSGGSDTTLTDLLAIRMVWEEALADLLPGAATGWQDALAVHAKPVAPAPDQVLDAILQEAAERAFQRKLGGMLADTKPVAPETAQARPAMQAAFCIDVRSEVFRRALETLDPAIATIGFAGFFGLPVAHRAEASDLTEAHLPVLLRPAMTSRAQVTSDADRNQRVAARAMRAWGRFRQAAVSSFAFVEAAGPFYAAKLLKSALSAGHGHHDAAPPRPDPALTTEAKTATARAVLTAMGLGQDLAPLVLLIGHGASTTNNPHASAYHCGACGGHTGEVSARLLATLLNDPETRKGLAAEGTALPDDTVFVAGLHDTTTDEVRLYPDGSGADLTTARRWLSRAGAMSRAERAARLPGATPATVAARALNWAEVRPEWGLAGCAAFIAAPRAATAGVKLGGRAFLHSYDWRQDKGFATLELILTAPVVVASWISLQYYASSVAPAAFGGGNKLIHNPVGGFGVVQGNGGTLCAGLPWQAVYDGAGLAHDPLRLTVLVDAPEDAISEVLGRHDGVRALFDRGWMHMLTMHQGRIAARYRPGNTWAAEPVGGIAA
jgi:uncharacterized protein YbcC (UPF0753/DUF2309 family)